MKEKNDKNGETTKSKKIQTNRILINIEIRNCVKNERSASDKMHIQILLTVACRCMKVTPYILLLLPFLNITMKMRTMRIILNNYYFPPPLSLKASPPKAKQNKFDKRKRKQLK